MYDVTDWGFRLNSFFAQSCILTKFCPMWKTRVFGLIIFMGFNTIYNRTYSVEWVNVQFHSLSSLVKHPRLFAQSCISSNNGNRAVINITDCCTPIIFFGKMNDFTALGFLLKSFSTNLHFDKILSSYTAVTLLGHLKGSSFIFLTSFYR